MSLNQIRSHFPSLTRELDNNPLIYLDGPGGTQVPEEVTSAMTAYYERSNTNTHGMFVTSRETDEIINCARGDAAVLLGAEGSHNISFGQNMTTLNYSLARSIGRFLRPGDEIVITQLDHEGNRGPWLSLREKDIIVREVRLTPDGTLDYEDFEQKVNERTRLVAVGLASNALGTVNEIGRIRKLTYQFGSWLLLDAVHYAPHFAIDVQALGCDFLLCSAYKFYGPHVGILYCKTGLLDQLATDRLRTADQMAPYSIETGTLNHAALAGVSAAIRFISHLGDSKDLRKALQLAYQSIGKHERSLAEKLNEGLHGLKGVKVVGPAFGKKERAPTISFTVSGKTPVEVCQILGKQGICAWDGHFYALRAIEVMGLLEKGGVTRMGFSVYNTSGEVDLVISAMKKLVS